MSRFYKKTQDTTSVFAKSVAEATAAPRKYLFTHRYDI